MTKEEAIKILSTRDAHGVLCGYTSGVTEALDMAIEALLADVVSRENCDQCKIDQVGVLEQQLAELQGDYETMKNAYEDALAHAVQGWNNHEVACILAELFGDDCACNYNGIDEWLPMVCDFKDNCQTVGVACWEQFLKHYVEAWGNNFNEQLSKSIKYEQTKPYKGSDTE